jgi:hypothetical protein
MKEGHLLHNRVNFLEKQSKLDYMLVELFLDFSHIVLGEL